MVVANSWGVGNAALSVALPKHCCMDFLGKKESSLSFVGSMILKKPKSRNSRNSNLTCRCSDSSSSSSSDWDWNRWNRHFSEIEQAESLASVLKFQLEEAIEKEDFQEAAKLKTSIAEATSKDIVAEIMSQLKTAIDEERYHEASKLCRLTGSGLVGWWVGFPKDSSTDPFGRVVRITPSLGRFVARSYTPRQLVTASSGTPLFEIFIAKDAKDSYIMQVVFLLREKGTSMESTLPPLKLRRPSFSNSENISGGDNPGSEETVAKGSEVKSLEPKDETEEGIKSVIKFLKDKIPGLKVKMKNITVQDESIGNSDSLEKITQEDGEKTISAENSEDEAGNPDDIPGKGMKLGEDTDTMDEGKRMAMKLFIGGVLHKREDVGSKDDYVRTPASIEDMEKDSFVLHIPVKNKGIDFGESKVSNIEVAAIAAQGISELMPLDVANAFWGVDKAPSKVSKEIREMAKLAISQKLNSLAENTSFQRIYTSTDDLDPFDGLYVGAFGPYGTEVVQLRRKFGHWNDADQKNSDVEFYEYVEAVKLTGDFSVPAGQVIFRAKIGKGNRTVNRGMYPDEVGVAASYKGQGRIAEFGFRNPRWVDGELLQLNGKGMEVYLKGAELGFLYAVTGKRFLVMFKRLRLPEF